MTEFQDNVLFLIKSIKKLVDNHTYFEDYFTCHYTIFFEKKSKKINFIKGNEIAD